MNRVLSAQTPLKFCCLIEWYYEKVARGLCFILKTNLTENTFCWSYFGAVFDNNFCSSFEVLQQNIGIKVLKQRFHFLIENSTIRIY